MAMRRIINSWHAEELTAPWPLPVPAYLEEIYWWAYVHPNAVAFFEREWLVNLILFGNLRQLRDATLCRLGSHLDGRTLQVACVYGNFSARLAERLTETGSLDIVDVLPVQLENVRRKLGHTARVRTLQRNSANLLFADASFDRAVIFFLLHEQPQSVRNATLREVLRVLRPGGKLVIMDYHLPSRFHPLRYMFKPILQKLEPFALDLWNNEIEAWLPPAFEPQGISKVEFFGGLYQLIELTK